MSASLSWSIVPFDELTEDEVLELCAVINRANAPEHAPVWEIFRDERVDPGSIKADYVGQSLVRLRDGGVLIGTMTLGVEGRDSTISIFALAPEYRGRGLARAFFDQAEAFAQTHGCAALRLDAVDVGSLVAHYQKHGFDPINRIEYPVGKWGAVTPFDLVTLVKPL